MKQDKETFGGHYFLLVALAVSSTYSTLKLYSNMASLISAYYLGSAEPEIATDLLLEEVTRVPPHYRCIFVAAPVFAFPYFNNEHDF